MEIIKDLNEDLTRDHHNQRILAKRSKRLEFVDDDQEIVHIENNEVDAENANNVKKKNESVTINTEIRDHTTLSNTHKDHNHTNHSSLSSRNRIRISGGLVDEDDIHHHHHDSADNYNYNYIYI